MEKLTLKIVTPRGCSPDVVCDSVRLTISDRADGSGGGSCGIRRGHAEALLTLGAGTISAYLAGACLLHGRSGGGFATVAHDVVTAVVESFEPEEAPRAGKT